ncbi:hypothetical protein LY76DRAFT_353737 [Colletotrichum caudatum]|nr:hypothetical protein LY76DRAFT_353737 [Colletotrichum caudatum]
MPVIRVSGLSHIPPPPPPRPHALKSWALSRAGGCGTPVRKWILRKRKRKKNLQAANSSFSGRAAAGSGIRRGQTEPGFRGVRHRMWPNAVVSGRATSALRAVVQYSRVGIWADGRFRTSTYPLAITLFTSHRCRRSPIAPTYLPTYLRVQGVFWSRQDTSLGGTSGPETCSVPKRSVSGIGLYCTKYCSASSPMHCVVRCWQFFSRGGALRREAHSPGWCGWITGKISRSMGGASFRGTYLGILHLTTQQTSGNA